MGTSLSVARVPPDQLFLDRMPSAVRRAFLLCIKLPLFSASRWYLAGGTALALQVGHRKSVDLDFFTPRRIFFEDDVERELLATGEWATTLRRKGTIYGTLLKAKMSLIAYPFFIPSKEKNRHGTVQMLLPHDIAAMKIVTVSQRGRKRDFVDLYWYCLNREPLGAVIRRAVSQFPGQEDNITHILKSLTYFADAEADPMPTIFFRADWRGIKNYFRREASKIVQNELIKAP